ncbi:unnamed protein product [Parajaminaea phylloscopi]
MSSNRFTPSDRPQGSRPTTVYTGVAGGSSTSRLARPLGSEPAPARSSVQGASRFGFRAPSNNHEAPSTTVAATPLGKRTLSNTSLPEGTPSSVLASAKRPIRSGETSGHNGTTTTPGRASRPPSPSASHQLSTLKSHYESRLLLAQQSYGELEDSYRTLAAEVERHKSSRRELLEEWERSKEERSNERSTWQHDRETLRTELASLRRRYAEQEEDLAESSQASSRDRQVWQAERRELMARISQLEASQHDAQESRRLAEEQWRQDEEERRRRDEDVISELRDQLDKAQSSKAKQEDAVVQQELHHIVKQSRQLEVEVASLKTANASLRKQADGAAILKEENLSLRKKADLLAQAREHSLRLEEREEKRNRELEEWDRLLSSPEAFSPQEEATAALAASQVDEPETPSLPAMPSPLQRSSLPVYLSQLRGFASGLITRTNILTSQVQRFRSEAAAASSEAEVSQKELTQLREQTEVWRDKENQWARGRRQWEDELSRYRELLKSYEQQQQATADIAGASNAMPSDSAEPNAAPRDEDAEMTAADTTQNVNSAGHKVYLERIALLEKDVSSKTSQLEQLLSEHEAHTRHMKAEHQETRDELASLRSELTELQRENVRLDEALGKAEERLGLGEFNVEKYRCLVLKQNPVDIDRDLRTKTMDRLKGENEELIKRVGELSERLDKVQASAIVEGTAVDGQDLALNGGLVPASTLANLREEIAALHTSIATKDKAMLRLKQVYSAKASEFREAVQSLFGFKVRFKENGAVQLNSTFARSSSRATSLVFHSEPGNVGRMSLAGEAVNDTSLANVPHLREYWLGTGMRQSVPCFLAALQLELYESTTQAVRGAWTVPDADEDE